MCLVPVTIKRDYRTIDGRTTDIVPCGKCPKCLKRRQHEWSFRLYEELKVSTSSVFLTLTYEEVPFSNNGHPTLVKSDLQKFFKRLRKKLGKSKIKYYAVGEYGGLFNRPHYHIICFNLPKRMVRNYKPITEIWNEGLVHFGTVNPQSIAYTCGYVMSGKWIPENELDDRQPHFATMSKRLGASYLTPQMVHYLRAKLEGAATMPGGWRVPLPRYFKGRAANDGQPLFTKEERKLIAEVANEMREFNFEKIFDSDAEKHITWIKDQYRKQEKYAKENKSPLSLEQTSIQTIKDHQVNTMKKQVKQYLTKA